MPPDRRFGLPHPLDAEPPEDSTRRKSGIWESLKRALGAPAPEPTNPPAFHRPDTAPPLPAMPPLRTTALPADPPAPLPEPPAAPLSGGEEQTLVTPVPFLEDPANERIEGAAAPIAAPPVSPSAPATPGPAAPRLARGLASFSKSNAEREKRFGHLLREGPSGKKKPRGPGGGG